jgi:predicted Zn-dependent protease
VREPGGGAAINVAGGAIFARFSRNDEAEADAVGVQFVTRAGIDPRGIPAMFRILMNERQSRPAGVEAWFLTHPLEEDRIEATTAMIARSTRRSSAGSPRSRRTSSSSRRGSRRSRPRRRPAAPQGR